MFDIIPVASYADVYFFGLLMVVLFSILNLLKYKLTEHRNVMTSQFLTFVLFFFAIFYMGLREINGYYFGDMGTYNSTFLKIQNQGITAIPKHDYLFYYFMYLCTLIMSNKVFFLIIDILYFLPIYIVSSVNFKKGAFYSIFLLVGSFSYWTYGTNGIRNGLATSCFLLVFATQKKWIQGLILFISIQLHSSMLIPTAAFIVAYFYKHPKHILYGWLACIPISLLLGGPIQSLFAGLMEDSRTSYLTEGNKYGDNFSSTGFRWDFLIYSASAVFAGWYYIFKKKFEDQRYNLIFGTYVIANAFWILVIKANFSNRFAYLSWFMMALVIVYPLLKQYLFGKNHQKVIIYIMLAYFGFTFLMNVIIY